LILTANVWARPLAVPNTTYGPAATTINYQGRLHDADGNPLSDTYTLSFTLYDAKTGGNVVWGPENHVGVVVTDGLFDVGLGSVIPGGIPTTVWSGDRYLEVAVDGQALSPRELIRSVPIAGMALTVPDGAIGTSQIADSSVTQSKIAQHIKTISMQYGSDNTGGVSTHNDLGYMIRFSANATGFGRAMIKLPTDWKSGTNLRIAALVKSNTASQTLAPRFYYATLNTGSNSWDVSNMTGESVSLQTSLTDITLLTIPASGVSVGDTIVVAFRFPGNTNNIDVTGVYLEYVAGN